MRQPGQIFFALVLACFCLNACVALDETPLDRTDLGTYIISSFQVPRKDRSATAWAQRMMGKAVILTPDRVAFPEDFGLQDCQHQGYRFSTRSAAYLPPFDLGAAGTVSLQDLNLTDPDLIEVWSACLNGAYLSVDRNRLYLPARGAVFVLQKQ